MFPLRNGTSEQFAAVNHFLKHSGYTERNICERTGVDAMHELVGKDAGARLPSDARDVLALLIRLFLSRESVETAQRGLPVPAAFKSLGLLREDPEHPGSAQGTMALYPAHGLYFVSDYWIFPDSDALKQFEDIVFPAISQHTFHFLDILPVQPCESFLDLCSGTGVAALVAASRYARHAWAVDITERATRCAEFSRRLNGIENATVIQGNLYEPLGELTFDRIVAHPPYVPVLKPGKVYFDGGEDGERVTRGIVKGLGRRLKPRGRFHCLAFGLDREGEPFELRVRNWLGEQSSAFDILYVFHRTQSLRDFAYQSTVHSQGDWGQVNQWLAHFEKLKVKEMIYGELVVQRKEVTGPPFTLRREKGERSGPAETDWLMGWEAESARPESIKALMESKPAASAELELHVVHRVQDGELAPTSFRLETDYPFSMECKIQPWMAMMVARFDGKSSVAEVFKSCKQDHLIDPQTPVGEFVKLVRTFISGGFFLIEGSTPPAIQKS